MKVFHFLLGLVLYLSIAACGLALMVSTQYPDFIQTALTWASDLPAWARVLAGVGVILYLFIYLLTAIAWRRRRSFITFENESGTVSVSTDAVREYLNSLKDEFAAVVWLKSQLRASRGALAVGLVLGVKDGTQIPELCKLIQGRVRELLEEHLGTCDLSGVSVEVNEIQTRKKSATDLSA